LRAEGLFSKELSSSSDETPSWNMPGFCAGETASLLEGTGSPDMALALNEVETGEKPCTTEPLLISPSDDTEVSELLWSLFLVADVLVVVMVVPDIHESVEFCNGLLSVSSSVGFSASAGNEDIEALIDGDRGPNSDFSCIWTTIFFKVVGVRCGSLPLDFDRALSSSARLGLLLLFSCEISSSSPSLPLSSELLGEFDSEGT